ncbi:carboxypeptidase-like regulatory domain-containing protein [Hymenobacter metallilatus]
MLSFLLLFLVAQAVAQRVLRGTVVDKSTGQGIPGITVLARTDIGTTTNSNGTFSIRISGDTATLWVGGFGFVARRVRVVAGDTSVSIRLATSCTVDYFYRPYVGISVNSGLRYTPLGGQLTLFRPNLWAAEHMQPAGRLELLYRRGPRTTYRAATVAIDELVATCQVNIDVALQLEQLKGPQPDNQFERRSAGINFQHDAGFRPFPVWVAVGQARGRGEEIRGWRTGLELGTEREVRISQKRAVEVAGRVGWWQTVWQWQSTVSWVSYKYIAAATYQRIGASYQEISVRLGIQLTPPHHKHGAN